MPGNFHQRYLELVDAIEQRFAVSSWRSGDADVWPLARMDLYLDMYWSESGGRHSQGPRLRRALTHAARPLTTLWQRRRDLRDLRLRPQPADAIFLGDGVSFDLVGGAWQDRYCEPLIAALQTRGRSSFVMTGGGLERRPWRRPAFPAGLVESLGQALARRAPDGIDLPEHAEVLAFLEANAVTAPSLKPERLARRLRVTHATARLFERMLDRVHPRLAFVVTYYAGLGHAFALACRRRGILCVDLQHCPQGPRHKAYRWPAPPSQGYTTLPSVFWNWTESDARNIVSWTEGSPWHRSLPGGHLARHGRTPAIVRGLYAREILVALQSLESGIWDRLADQIRNASPDWRWWIRRHPAAGPAQDTMFGGLLRLHGENVRVDDASAMPLTALLPQMDAVVSHSSGTAVEAASFGVPAFFLSPAACGPFGDLIDSGGATLVDDIRQLTALIAALPEASPQRAGRQNLDLDRSLDTLDRMAACHAQLCARPYG